MKLDPSHITFECTGRREYVHVGSIGLGPDASAVSGGYDHGVADPDYTAENWPDTDCSLTPEERTTSEAGAPTTRNPRSVRWVPTEPCRMAHFATYPQALIKPFILAGCPPGGTVLDPFGGSGTTGLVADQLRRSAILIDLDDRNDAMARERITAPAPLLAQVESVTKLPQG